MLYDVTAKTIKDVSTPAFDTDAGAPQWTADGKRLTFVTGKRAYNEAFTFDLTTGKYTQLSSKARCRYARAARTARRRGDDGFARFRTEVYVTDPAFATFRKLTTPTRR